MSKKVEELERRLARHDFAHFCRYVRPEYTNSWHHRLLHDVLQKFADHDPEYCRLIITAPPRHGKSEYASRLLPAFLIGRQPTKNIILGSYNNDTAGVMARGTKRVMKEEPYQSLYGDVISPDRDAALEFVTHEGGTYKAAGLTAGVTGRPANYIIIDDYLRNRTDAESDPTRDKIWNEFNDSFLTRIEYPNSVLVMATRWHHDDLIGRILESPDADDWKVIHLPFMMDIPGEHDYDPREFGEPLWPERYKADYEYYEGEDKPQTMLRDAVRVTKEEVVDRALKDFRGRYNRNPHGTEALFQGRPAPLEGIFFKRASFQTYPHRPVDIVKTADQIVLSVDCSFKRTSTSDFVSIGIFARKGVDIYLVDEVHQRMDYPETKKAIQDQLNKYPDATILVEESANGAAIIADMRQTVSRIVAFTPREHGNKEARANMAVDTVEAGNFHVPEKRHAPWIDEWLEEICGFPDRPHDDRVDSMSQACIHLGKRMSGLRHLNAILGIEG